MKAERAKDFLTDARAVRAPARAPAWVVRAVKTALAFADLALALLSFMAAFHFRQGFPIFQYTPSGSVAWTREFAPYAALLPFVLPHPPRAPRLLRFVSPAR